MINFFRDLFDPAVLGGMRRSSEWPSVRRKHLEAFPYCAVCNGTKKLQVHHLRPFHLFPALELDPTNLATLCTRKKYGINCHLLVGHHGSFRKMNENCLKDIIYIRGMLVR